MSVVALAEDSENLPVSAASSVSDAVHVQGWRAKRYQNTKILMGMPILPVLYQPRHKKFIKIGTQFVDSLRYEAKREKAAFVKWLAATHGSALMADLGFTSDDLAAMQAGGNPPAGYDVHHRMPLGGCQDPEILRRANGFDNLVLIRIEREHAAIHQFVQPQIDDLRGSGIVYLPTPIGYWQKPLPPAQMTALAEDGFQSFCDYEIERQSALGLAIQAGRKFMENKHAVPRAEDDRFFECSAKILVTARAKKPPRPRPVRAAKQPGFSHPVHPRAGAIKALAAEYPDELRRAFNLTADELQKMQGSGRLPRKLTLCSRLPVRYTGTWQQREQARQPENMILTSSTIKHEFDRQMRKQFRNLKSGQKTSIIMPVFDKPWFSNNMDPPDLTMLVDKVEKQAGFYPPINPDLDIAARHEALYEKPAEPEVPPPTKNGKKQKKPLRQPDVFINTPYLAFDVTVSKPELVSPAAAVPLHKESVPPPVLVSGYAAPSGPTHEEIFVKWVAIQFEEQIRSDLRLGNIDIEQMKTKGKLPRHLTVWHHVPLRACGEGAVFERYDHFDNMVILPVDMSTRFNKVIKSQLSGMHPGQTKIIDVPLVPGYWPRRMGAPECDQYGAALVAGFEIMQREQNSALAHVMKHAQGGFHWKGGQAGLVHSSDSGVVAPILRLIEGGGSPQDFAVCDPVVPPVAPQEISCPLPSPQWGVWP